MKKRSLFGFLCKQEEPVKVFVYGITTGEYCKICSDIEEELNTASSRQRTGTKEPSAYMKGLQFALNLLKAVKPHIVGVEQ